MISNRDHKLDMICHHTFWIISLFSFCRVVVQCICRQARATANVESDATDIALQTPHQVNTKSESRWKSVSSLHLSLFSFPLKVHNKIGSTIVQGVSLGVVNSTSLPCGRLVWPDKIAQATACFIIVFSSPYFSDSRVALSGAAGARYCNSQR